MRMSHGTCTRSSKCTSLTDDIYPIFGFISRPINTLADNERSGDDKIHDEKKRSCDSSKEEKRWKKKNVKKWRNKIQDDVPWQEHEYPYKNQRNLKKEAENIITNNISSLSQIISSLFVFSYISLLDMDYTVFSRRFVKETHRIS